jgi:homeobox protein ESX1
MSLAVPDHTDSRWTVPAAAESPSSWVPSAESEVVAPGPTAVESVGVESFQPEPVDPEPFAHDAFAADAVEPEMVGPVRVEPEPMATAPAQPEPEFAPAQPDFVSTVGRARVPGFVIQDIAVPTQSVGAGVPAESDSPVPRRDPAWAFDTEHGSADAVEPVAPQRTFWAPRLPDLPKPDAAAPWHAFVTPSEPRTAARPPAEPPVAPLEPPTPPTESPSWAPAHEPATRTEAPEPTAWERAPQPPPASPPGRVRAVARVSIASLAYEAAQGLAPPPAVAPAAPMPVAPTPDDPMLHAPTTEAPTAEPSTAEPPMADASMQAIASPPAQVDDELPTFTAAPGWDHWSSAVPDVIGAPDALEPIEPIEPVEPPEPPEPPLPPMPPAPEPFPSPYEPVPGPPGPVPVPQPIPPFPPPPPSISTPGILTPDIPPPSVPTQSSVPPTAVPIAPPAGRVIARARVAVPMPFSVDPAPVPAVPAPAASLAHAAVPDTPTAHRPMPTAPPAVVDPTDAAYLGDDEDLDRPIVMPRAVGPYASTAYPEVASAYPTASGYPIDSGPVETPLTLAEAAAPATAAYDEPDAPHYATGDWRRNIRGSTAHVNGRVYRDERPPPDAAVPLPAPEAPEDEPISTADKLARAGVIALLIVMFVLAFIYGPAISEWLNN